MTDQQEIENREGSALNNKKTAVPQLYSKRLILIFALLFSSIFSAVLLMSNLRNIGKEKARREILLFAISYFILTALLIGGLNLPQNLTFVANVIGAAILNEYFWNKHIGAETEYQKKSWIKPALISLGIAVFFFILLMGSL